MASAFGHAAVAYALGKTMMPPIPSWRLWTLTLGCCFLPDVDIIGFIVGIPYEHVLGHRGITHSISFALLVGLVVPKMAVPTLSWRSGSYRFLVLYFFLVTLSHGLLDAMTNGGLGIAFFAPFDSTRYFFSWRPLTVSPIGVTQFFSAWGFGVLLSELQWVGIPVALWLLGWAWFQKWLKAYPKQSSK